MYVINNQSVIIETKIIRLITKYILKLKLNLNYNKNRIFSCLKNFTEIN